MRTYREFENDVAAHMSQAGCRVVDFDADPETKKILSDFFQHDATVAETAEHLMSDGESDNG